MKAIGEMNMGELAAFACSHLKKHGIDVVLSGGSCVSLYSAGKYVSYDLDFIETFSGGRRKLKKALAEIGFEEHARYFRHPDTPYFLEFPAGPLAGGEEPPGEIRAQIFATGELAALSPTDSVKDRLSAFYHWDDPECLEQALLVTSAADVDIAEIARWSSNEGQEDKFEYFKKLYEKSRQ